MHFAESILIFICAIIASSTAQQNPVGNNQNHNNNNLNQNNQGLFSGLPNLNGFGLEGLGLGVPNLVPQNNNNQQVNPALGYGLGKHQNATSRAVSSQNPLMKGGFGLGGLGLGGLNGAANGNYATSPAQRLSQALAAAGGTGSQNTNTNTNVNPALAQLALLQGLGMNGLNNVGGYGGGMGPYGGFGGAFNPGYGGYGMNPGMGYGMGNNLGNGMGNAFLPMGAGYGGYGNGAGMNPIAGYGAGYGGGGLNPAFNMGNQYNNANFDNFDD